MTERDIARMLLVQDMRRLSTAKIAEAINNWKPEDGPVVTISFHLTEKKIREALDPNYRINES